MEGVYVNESSGVTTLYDVLTGQPSLTFKGMDARPHTLSLMNDDHILWASNSKPVLNVFELNRRSQQVQKVVLPGPVSAMCVSEDGCYVVCGVKENVMVWDGRNGSLIAVTCRHYQEISCVEVTADSKYVVSGAQDGLVCVWSLHDLNNPDGSSNHPPVWCSSSHNLPVTSLWCSRIAGNRIFSASLDRTVKIHDVLTKQTLLTLVFDNCVTAMCVDDAETGLYVGCNDGRLCKVNLIEIAESSRRNLNFDPQSTDSVSCWKSLKAHEKKVTCVCIGLDSTTLVTGSLDNTVKFWDASTGQVVRTLTHQSQITDLKMAIMPLSLKSSDSKAEFVFPKLAHALTDSASTDESVQPCLLTSQARVYDDTELQLNIEECLLQLPQTSAPPDVLEDVQRRLENVENKNHQLYNYAIKKLFTH